MLIILLVLIILLTELNVAFSTVELFYFGLLSICHIWFTKSKWSMLFHSHLNPNCSQLATLLDHCHLALY